ncbi:MAG: DivIVA domain-containing protein [Actinomycetaceae bacterium]|nr:DivIVA domain-containing protein [Actinomycetaceae bacterium]
MQLLTDHDVINMRFKDPVSVQTGYDQDEVDDFLDRVAETIKQLTEENEALTNKLKIAEARASENAGASTASMPTVPAAGSQQGSAASEAAGVLVFAQQVYDEQVTKGEEESSRLIAAAQVKSKEIINEAETKRTQTLAKLEQEKSHLEKEIARLDAFENDYRTRLKSYLEQLLTSVESNSQSN